MAVEYVPQWISLLAAIEHVRQVAGGTLEAAWQALQLALREGAVMARFRGEEVGGIAEAIEGRSGAVPNGWWYKATVFADGSVEFTAERYDFRPRPPRREIEVQRAELSQYWPQPEAATPASAKPPPSRLKPFWPDAEAAVMEWLTENGCPRPRDGNRARLEAFSAEWLAQRGWEASEPTIRRHVSTCIKRYRDAIGVDEATPRLIG
jgi:hypothetical protein